MKIFVTRTVEIEAESLQEAMEKFSEGKHVTTSASPNRPTHTPLGARLHGQRPTSILPQPIPREDWPLWVKALAMIAKPEDKGIGDVVHRTIGAENSEAFKKWFKTTTGKDCGCVGRQRIWNIEYPL